MGLIRECDIYPGRTKNVDEYLIEVTRLRKGDGEDGIKVRHTKRFMCPAALNRMDTFLDRGTKAPPK
jgi:hypothetical protein